MNHPILSFFITLLDFAVPIGLFFGAGALLQWMGTKGILFATPLANHYGLIVRRGGTTEEKNSGGDVVGIVHAIPGHRVRKVGYNLMDWWIDPRRESRDFLFRKFGIVWLGFFNTIRVNKIRTFRFGRTDEETKYHIMAKTSNKRWVPFTGQQDLEINDIETKDALAVNLKVNIPFADKFPIRARLKIADAYAVLTILVKEKVISVVGMKDLSEIIGPNSKPTKDAITQAIMADEEREKIEKEIGITINGSVSIFDVSMNQKTEDLMELKAEAKKEMIAEVTRARLRIKAEEANAKAEVAKAEGEKKATILRNDAQADHVERVINPIAENQNRIRVREAEALENSKLTTLVTGGNSSFGVFKQTE